MAEIAYAYAKFDPAPDLRERCARAIYMLRPDEPWRRNPWPETPKQRRAYQHNPVAAIDLSFAYADAVIEIIGLPARKVAEDVT